MPSTMADSAHLGCSLDDKWGAGFASRRFRRSPIASVVDVYTSTLNRSRQITWIDTYISASCNLNMHDRLSDCPARVEKFVVARGEANLYYQARGDET